MPKDFFTFYVDADRPQKGTQSKHVATVVIRHVNNGVSQFYQVGVAGKHQRDKLPFVKSEGRRIARDRAIAGYPIDPNLDHILEEVNDNLYLYVKDYRTRNRIRWIRINDRIREVLVKFDPTLAPRKTALQRFLDKARNYFDLRRA